MTTYTGQNIVDGALRLISSVTPGEAIDGTEAANALVVLNAMYAGWSIEGLMIPFRTIDVFTLTIGTQSYTIGQNGTPSFNTVRPDEVTDCWITDTVAGVDYEMRPWSESRYNSTFLKSNSGLPQWYYYDPQYPNGVLYLYPTSIKNTYNINIQSKKPVMQFANLNSSLILPPEYFKASKFLLADDLGPEYGYPIQEGSRLAKKIDEQKRFIKRKNIVMTVAQFDDGLARRRSGNILNGFTS